MNGLRGALAALLAGCAAVSPAAADAVFRELRGWKVIIADDYKGCVAVARYPGETWVRYGIDGISRTPFINVSNRRWVEFTLDTYYQVTLQTDMGEVFAGAFRAVLRDGLPTLEYGDLSTAFIEAFASASYMTMTVDGRRLAEFSLAGTRMAVSEVVRCRDTLI